MALTEKKLTAEEIRNLIQSEYDKNKVDTNYNFINRFARAVYEGLSLSKEGKEEAEVERIICASNYYNDGVLRDFRPKNTQEGFVICGHRHHNCISTFAQMYGFPYSKEAMEIHKTEIQGFLTNTNRFVGRKEALEIARKAKQLITGDGNDNLGLFSEDLY